jgi:hypothetical protein
MAWIVVLALCLVGIGQAFSFGVFHLAMLGMLFFGLTQISVSNVPPDSGPRGFIRYNIVFLAVLIGVVGLSIWLAPILTDLGR